MDKTHYIWDYANDSYLMEKDETGATTAVYTNEPVPHGTLISQRRGDETSYYHFDSQGSTRQLTDQNQNVTDEYTYSAFGETVVSSGTTANHFQYKGRIGYIRVSETGDVLTPSRVYRPVLGIYISAEFFAAQVGPIGNYYPVQANSDFFVYQIASGPEVQGEPVKPEDAGQAATKPSCPNDARNGECDTCTETTIPVSGTQLVIEILNVQIGKNKQSLVVEYRKCVVQAKCCRLNADKSHRSLWISTDKEEKLKVGIPLPAGTIPTDSNKDDLAKKSFGALPCWLFDGGAVGKPCKTLFYPICNIPLGLPKPKP